MYLEIYRIIEARVSELGPWHVAPALGDEPPYPAVQPYLHNDEDKRTGTTRFRELKWAIKITVAHDETPGAAQEQMMGILDALRDGFDQWVPDGYTGIQTGFHVDTVRIEGYRDHGETIYLMILSLRVIPQAFGQLP